ncbi:MAG TPA: hypothetical protein VK335_32640 [Bryobacteraceae bacterium]|nr:hypothetical protein [Bryobacteraceae bacterium]
MKRPLRIISGASVYIRPVHCESPNDLGATTPRYPGPAYRKLDESAAGRSYTARQLILVALRL